MNIIELVRSALQAFPKIEEIGGAVHIDTTDDYPTSYGLSSTGDALLSCDVLGNESRKHTFVLYAVYQSQSDYERISNSGTILELQAYLERYACGQQLTVSAGDSELSGSLTRLTCANGMLYSIPNNNFNSGVRYQLQITAEYEVEREAFF